MTLQIISPDGVVHSSESQAVKLPGGAGSFEVLRGHAPMVSTLVAGEVVSDGKAVMQIAGGVVEVANDAITLYIGV